MAYQQPGGMGSGPPQGGNEQHAPQGTEYTLQGTSEFLRHILKDMLRPCVRVVENLADVDPQASCASFRSNGTITNELGIHGI